MDKKKKEEAVSMERIEEQKNDASEHKSVYDVMEQEITESDIPDKEKTRRLSNLLRLRNQKVNILVTGATGVGKSSTINALFNMEVAKVGVDVDQETTMIQQYELDNLTIWDTPGLGDNVNTDKKIKKQMIKKLNEATDDGKALIDLALVLVDASSKDLGTSFAVINDILIPCFGKDAEKRIIVALNQADVAMKGKHWDVDKNEPDKVLQEYLEKKAASVKDRLYEATGLKLTPIYFCAGYTEAGDEEIVRRPYNLSKLLFHIVQAIPKEKRLALVDNLSNDEENFAYDDHKKDYRRKTVEAFWESVGDGICEGVETGLELGEDILGIPGMVIGGILGGIFGAVKGVCRGIAG